MLATPVPRELATLSAVVVIPSNIYHIYLK
jgi:hypothetical protein